MDLKEIKRLIAVVQNADISHFSIEEEGTKIEIKKENSLTHSISSIAPPIVPQQHVALPPVTPRSVRMGLYLLAIPWRENTDPPVPTPPRSPELRLTANSRGNSVTIP